MAVWYIGKWEKALRMYDFLSLIHTLFSHRWKIGPGTSCVSIYCVVHLIWQRLILMEYTEACFGTKIYQHRNVCIEIAKQSSYSERIAIYTWRPICYCRVFNQTVFGISEASLLWNAFSISRLSLVCMAAAPNKGPRRNMSKLLNMKDRSIPVIMACVPDNMEKHDDNMTSVCILH